MKFGRSRRQRRSAKHVRSGGKPGSTRAMKGTKPEPWRKGDPFPDNDKDVNRD